MKTGSRPEMEGFEQRLVRHWKAYVAKAGLRPRDGIGRLRVLWLSFVHVGYFRIFAWGAVIASESANWSLCALLATAQALVRTGILLGRGHDEFQLSLYGANDDELLGPTRKAQKKHLILALVDASVILGVWWLLERVPGWAFLLGVPAFVIGASISPRILAAVLPGWSIPWLSITTFLCFPILLILSPKASLPPGWAEGIFFLAGALSPAGWMVVMIRGLLEGRLILLGGLLVLAAGVVLARAFARSQDEKLVAAVTTGNDGRYLDDNGDLLEEIARGPEYEEENATDSLRARLGETLRTTRQLDLADVPASAVSKSRPGRKALWTAGIVLGIAVLGRPEIFGVGSFRYFLLGVALFFAYNAWLPLSGLPAWFQNASLSANRVCSIFAIYPVSFRELMFGQIKRDCMQALRTLPLLTLLALAAFQISLYPDWTASLLCAVTISLAALFFLPLRWYHLALSAQANQPFRAGLVARVGLMILVVVLFSLEFVMMIFFFSVGSDAMPGASWLFSGAVLVVGIGLVNALAGLAGFWLAVRAFEKERYDLVRNLPKSS